MSGRTLPWLLLVLVVLTAGAASAVWAEARGEAQQYIAWTLAGAVLAVGATGWWVLHRAAAEIVALQAQIEQVQARLEALPSSHERFVDHLAHELKTPLTIVLNQAELILRCSDDPAAVRGLAKSIADYLLHLSDLFEGFLRLGSPFWPADTSQHVPVHIHDLVVEAVRRSQSIARGGGVTVVAMLAEPGREDTALEVLGNAALLVAMIENVVRNAVRFSRRGSSMELQVQVRGGSILLNVRTHGSGMVPSRLESMFDWSFPAPDGTRPVANLGVGLAIARRVAEHHRGTISLRNHPEGGCEFEITLPRWRAEGLSSSAGGAPVAALPVARLAEDVMQ